MSQDRGLNSLACPFCQHRENRVKDMRPGRTGEFNRRRRECTKCGRRFTTYEYIEDTMPVVRKRGGGQEPFDRLKLRRAISRAHVAGALAERVEADVLGWLNGGEGPVDSDRIAARIAGHLLLADVPAYVRFVSAHRRFTHPRQFVDLARELGVAPRGKAMAGAR